MKTWRWPCIFVFLLFLPATCLAAENGNTPLILVVSNFDFGTFTEEGMLEYVDSLSFQIGKIVDADYVSSCSGLYGKVMREYGKFQVRGRDGKDRPLYRYIIDGALRSSNYE